MSRHLPRGFQNWEKKTDACVGVEFLLRLYSLVDVGADNLTLARNILALPRENAISSVEFPQENGSLQNLQECRLFEEKPSFVSQDGDGVHALQLPN